MSSSHYNAARFLCNHGGLLLMGNALLEGVYIRLTWHLHNHDMTRHEYEGGFMHV